MQDGRRGRLHVSGGHIRLAPPIRGDTRRGDEFSRVGIASREVAREPARWPRLPAELARVLSAFIHRVTCSKTVCFVWSCCYGYGFKLSAYTGERRAGVPYTSRVVSRVWVFPSRFSSLQLLTFSHMLQCNISPLARTFVNPPAYPAANAPPACARLHDTHTNNRTWASQDRTPRKQAGLFGSVLKRFFGGRVHLARRRYPRVGPHAVGEASEPRARPEPLA